jgi:hypothetical protein
LKQVSESGILRPELPYNNLMLVFRPSGGTLRLEVQYFSRRLRTGTYPPSAGIHSVDKISDINQTERVKTKRTLFFVFNHQISVTSFSQFLKWIVFGFSPFIWIGLVLQFG